MPPEKPSGQLSDPGREHQIEQKQDPSGQTGVQTGRVDGKPVPPTPEVPDAVQEPSSAPSPVRQGPSAGEKV